MFMGWFCFIKFSIFRNGQNKTGYLGHLGEYITQSFGDNKPW